ncbi:MAG: PDC sensor domain-containing protein [Pseudomonadota bacterium]|nr:PDC sensor domain-containing protein [Pseudomonadota bacterium]
MIRTALALLITITIFTTTSIAQERDAGLYLKHISDDIKSIESNPVIISHIIASNKINRDISNSEILLKDNQWRRELITNQYNFINSVLNADASRELKKIKNNRGNIYGEIFIMNNKGLTIAMTQPTSDYWQGDEAKWQETFPANGQSFHLGDVEFDESVQAFTAQVSAPIKNSARENIGAITFGILME